MKSKVVELSAARASLIKHLIRLNLIEEKGSRTYPADCSLEPIAFFDTLELLQEHDAIALVAKTLSIEAVVIESGLFQSYAESISQDLLERVPLERWRELKALPIEMRNGRLLVAFANPLDREAKATLDFALGEPVLPMISAEHSIAAILTKRLAVSHSESVDSILQSQEPLIAPVVSTHHESVITARDVDAAQIVRLVNKILLDAIECGASDIHLTPEKGSMKVKARVDGILKDLLEVPGNLSASVVSRIKLLGGMDISEKRRPQDGRLRLEFGENKKDLRLSSIPSLHGENIVARILSPELGHVTFESLGMPSQVCKKLREDLTGSSRVILVTGPTGSGKTSTLYAAISELKLQGLNIITIEDPIEYRVPGILQTQVNPKIGLNFADGLRSILRQDPDVVVVGEIRDAETANIVMQVAQTGHLVLSTLHTNSAASAITRLCDLGVAPFMIASSIQSIMAQRLVRRSNQDKSGYSGRIGVYSYLQMSERLREAIRGSQGEANFEICAREKGFESLTEAAEGLISNGTTTLEEAERVFGVRSSWSIPTLSQPEKRTSLKRRVLVVEDDDNMRLILNMLLSRALYEVVEACDGRVALESILNDPPDLVVSDLMMPELDGADLVAILKRDPRTSRIPVLLLTAVASEETELKLLQCGADDFVSKTSDQKILLARVEKLINRSVAH